MKIVIVEDEPFAQQELLRLIKKTGREYELLEMIDSVEDSIEWFGSNLHPDLVFLDIQLADGLSFEIFKEIELKSAVIFTTAYDEFAIRAFELNSIDYLLKPVKQEALEAALKKFDKMKHGIGPDKTSPGQEQLKQLLSLMSAKNYKNRFLTRIGDQIKSVGSDETAYFKAEDNVVFLIGNDGHKYIIDHTLEQLDEMIDPGRVDDHAPVLLSDAG
ncbi:MAG: LytTR family DNA-binding domain-containing protein [Bacteroidales bacterium]|nr:LytTR family DNA-binding domain-containing protein [Bacteroidales bacterium]